jgi:glucose-1-phosphate adenylyltransferase
MDLLDNDSLDLLNPNSAWKIYTEDSFSAPQYLSKNAKIKNCLINQGCYVEGEVNHSILFNDVKVGKGAKVIDSVVLPGCVIEDGAVVTKCIVDNNVIVKAKKVTNPEEKEILLVTKEEN